MIPYPLKSARPELFDLGKFQDNLPRPERSGLLSVGIGICVFISLITAVPYADIDWFRDCPIPVAATPHRTTWITFYPGEIKGKKPCTCHPDARYVGGKTQHFHETTEESCDSAPSAEREWLDVTLYTSGNYPDPSQFFTSGDLGLDTEPQSIVTDGNIIQGKPGQIRLHCDNDAPSHPRRPR